ncbi:MAG TPA: hypothetical protein VMD76_05740 [Candidatus Sulfotelmatobacter sp.]|nr:hypothetical protein [Candidatus Sulfotelmatobacter sp.]
MSQSLLAQDLPAHAGGAILHTQGGVWVNGSEAHDASAIFEGDVVETKPGSAANLSLEGTTVLLSPESVAKFEGDLLELDHGSVSVVTSKGFKVRVNCIRVIPVVNNWTEYVVSDLSGSVDVSAKKNDVNVEHEHGRGKPSPETEISQRASVHEGQQKSYDESEICGALKPTNASWSVSPKWIAAGAGGAGLLLLLLLHGSGSSNGQPISNATP